MFIHQFIVRGSLVLGETCLSEYPWPCWVLLLLCCIRPDIRVAHHVELMLIDLHCEFQYSLQFVLSGSPWSSMRSHLRFGKCFCI